MKKMENTFNPQLQTFLSLISALTVENNVFSFQAISFPGIQLDKKEFLLI
jgi:hypothetical protein